MPKPDGLHDIPNPHSSVAGRNHRDGTSWQGIRKQAKKFRPRGVRGESPVATVARFAAYLIDRATGRAYSADELMSGPSSEAILSAIGNGSIIDPAHLPLASSHVAYVRNGTSGVGAVGDASRPFATIRDALAAMPSGSSTPRNIVLLNSSISESFAFAPLAADPPFYVEASASASRAPFADVASSPPSALISVRSAQNGSNIRVSSNGTVGLDLPDLSDFGGLNLAVDVEGLASLSVAAWGSAPNEGPASFAVTARNCAGVTIDLVGTLSDDSHTDGVCGITLVNCGSNSSLVSITGDNGLGYFADAWIYVLGGFYMLLSMTDSSGSISVGGAAFSQTYSSPGYVDLGGNYDNEFW